MRITIGFCSKLALKQVYSRHIYKLTIAVETKHSDNFANLMFFRHNYFSNFRGLIMRGTTVRGKWSAGQMGNAADMISFPRTFLFFCSLRKGWLLANIRYLRYDWGRRGNSECKGRTFHVLRDTWHVCEGGEIDVRVGLFSCISDRSGPMRLLLPRAVISLMRMGLRSMTGASAYVSCSPTGVLAHTWEHSQTVQDIFVKTCWIAMLSAIG